MLENIAEMEMREKNGIEALGSYRIDDVYDPQKNPLHPESMTDEQVERYGDCLKMAKKFVKENGGDLYTANDNKHSIVVKDGMVYDYVLGYNLNINLEEYIKKMPFSFRKNNSAS